MTKKEHIAKHKELHDALDELMADMIAHTKMLPSKTTVMELAKWSQEQTISPTEEE